MQWAGVQEAARHDPDGIAPAPAVKAVVPLLKGAKDVRFEIVPGGHLGMLTGRRARTTTWQVLDEWVAQWSSDAEGVPTPAAKTSKKAPAKRAPAKQAAAKKSPSKQGAAKKAQAKKAAGKKSASAEAIGANPSRRYGSGGSRALSR